MYDANRRRGYKHRSCVCITETRRQESAAGTHAPGCWPTCACSQLAWLPCISGAHTTEVPIVLSSGKRAFTLVTEKTTHTETLDDHGPPKGTVGALYTVHN